MSYFKEIVLPSVGVSYKPTYNVTEGCKICNCHYSTFMGYVKKGLIEIMPTGRIYAKSFELLFEQRHIPKPKKRV
jgi:hypothetical protein